jgi:hypothetical protein
MGVSVADRMLIGPDDGYQAETGSPVTRHSLPNRSHHLVVLASDRPLCLVLTYSEFISIHMIACHHVLQLHTCPYTVVNLLACCPNIYVPCMSIFLIYMPIFMPYNQYYQPK